MKQNITHPLEDVFGMESGSFDIEQEYGMTEVPQNAVALTEPPVDHKDEDDVLVEKRLEIIEPRYAARNAEVAANYLNIALAAANSRAKVKSDRKRANQAFIPYAQGGKTTNNLVVANREDILKMINLDGRTKEIK